MLLPALQVGVVSFSRSPPPAPAPRHPPPPPPSAVPHAGAPALLLPLPLLSQKEMTAHFPDSGWTSKSARGPPKSQMTALSPTTGAPIGGNRSQLTNLLYLVNWAGWAIGFTLSSVVLWWFHYVLNGSFEAHLWELRDRSRIIVSGTAHVLCGSCVVLGSIA